MEVIVHGIILAFGLILPLGVQNIFIFTQGATQPTLLHALPATITAAICDTVLILLAIFGLSLLMMEMEWLRQTLMIAGIVFLLYMSVAIWRTEPSNLQEGSALPIKKQILFAISVSFLNPSALVDIVGVIGTSALKYSGTELILFTVACIVVSWLWFFALMFVGSRAKFLKNQQLVMNLLNKCSAIFIGCMAIYLAISLI